MFWDMSRKLLIDLDMRVIERAGSRNAVARITRRLLMHEIKMFLFFWVEYLRSSYAEVHVDNFYDLRERGSTIMFSC